MNESVPAAQPVSRKFSRYRAARGAGEVEMAPSPALVSSSEQNPSIARSRSRYRRNRPQNASGQPPTPAIADHARTPPRQHETRESPSVAKQEDGEARAREMHRQDAMHQLTGGDESQQIRRPEVSAQDRAPPHKEARLRQRADPAHPPRSAQSGDASRKSFFQKVNSKVRDHVKKSESVPKFIGVGGTGVVPGLDAPVSAVNAGERQASVKYKDATANLTITPSTQVRDLLLDAAAHLSRDIDADRFILMESFSQVGLERPLRRYEHIREVMNSWSHDSENRFIIIPPSSVEALAQLDAAHAPAEQPPLVTVHIYHSQHPRKWDKRYVTLRADGQVTVSKKEGSKEQTNICHLSDFDIYFPSAKALNKDVKPPKKLCFAIKSQQKSSMFLSTENFLHFFSTNDKAIADKWYRSVQKWRSWYLVNKLGACQKSEAEAPLKRSGTKRSSNQPRSLHHDVPLLDQMSSNDSPKRASIDQQRPTSSKDPVTRKKTQRGHAPPPSSYPRALAVNTDIDGPFTDKEALVSGISPAEVEASTFSPSGLLGRTYTQRQTAMRERDDREKRVNQEAFTGTGLMNGSGPAYDSNPNSRTNTMTRAPDVSAFNRTLSLSQKPLVDLTPVYAEPPQHSRKGKGHGVKVQPGMQLIDGATGPELTQGAIPIPPSTSWRRTDVPQRRNTTRSVHQPNTYASPTEGAPMSPNFTPNSLLAHSASTATPRKQRTGHGVATGDRNAAKPLLDMAPENPFADGSLLRQL
ncbi:uncharacterized protein N7529_010859 [Penicillium soppii]|uniref:uncharacterized protein n=1 Tax=Penicillium soppii TaxID=69789 RepID=UPI002548078B|nr:uncharacterized protein N7529_010859 [Penicillium soppii]KAJ5851474.1 hypothetical protein N7529_010859 [Penicillium soppii]